MYFCNFSSHVKISTSSHPMTLCGPSYDNACRKYQRWCNNINIQKQLLCPQLFRESYRTSNLSSFSFFFSVANSICFEVSILSFDKGWNFPKHGYILILSQKWIFSIVGNTVFLPFPSCQLCGHSIWRMSTVGKAFKETLFPFEMLHK